MYINYAAINGQGAIKGRFLLKLLKKLLRGLLNRQLLNHFQSS